MSCEGGEVKFDITASVSEVLTQIQLLERAINQLFSLMHKMGLPEEYEAMMTKVQRAIALWNLYRLTVIQAQLVSGPLGWTILGLGVAGTVVSTYDFMESELRGR